MYLKIVPLIFHQKQRHGCKRYKIISKDEEKENLAEFRKNIIE